MDIRPYRVLKAPYEKFIKYWTYFLLLTFPGFSYADVISSSSPGQVQQQLRDTVNIQQAVSARGPVITPIASVPLPRLHLCTTEYAQTVYITFGMY